MRGKTYKPGEITTDVWCGDLVVELEFIKYLSRGHLLFFNPESKRFHRAYYEVIGRDFVLNGWESAVSPAQLKT